MTKIVGRFKVDYNAMYDILYIREKFAEDSYGHEDDDGIIINKSYATEEILSVDIWDFKDRIENNIPINIPFEIDLKKLYDWIIEKENSEIVTIIPVTEEMIDEGKKKLKKDIKEFNDKFDKTLLECIEVDNNKRR